MKRRAKSNPVAMAMLRSAILKDVAMLKTTAELHAWTGADADRLLNSSGRVMWMVTSAAVECGVSTESPDMRIIRGMGEALGDLQADKRLEFHRPAIQSGLLAVERLLPLCTAMSLGTAALELDRMLATPKGMGTADLHALMNQKATA